MKIESNYMDFDDLLLYFHQLIADDSVFRGDKKSFRRMFC